MSFLFVLLGVFFLSYELGVRSARSSIRNDLLLGRDSLVAALVDRVDRLERDNIILKEKVESYSILGGVSSSPAFTVSNFKVLYDGSLYYYYALVAVGRGMKGRLLSLTFKVECEWLAPDGSLSRASCSPPGSVSFRYFSEVSGVVSTTSSDHHDDKLMRVFLTVTDKKSSVKKTEVFDYSSK